MLLIVIALVDRVQLFIILCLLLVVSAWIQLVLLVWLSAKMLLSSSLPLPVQGGLSYD